jgi:hypothetical protein
MKKKKKAAGRRVTPHAEEDATDELEALAAIYGAAFQLVPSGAGCFSVLVRATPLGGEALDADGVSAPPSAVGAPAVNLVRSLRGGFGGAHTVADGACCCCTQLLFGLSGVLSRHQGSETLAYCALTRRWRRAGYLTQSWLPAAAAAHTRGRRCAPPASHPAGEKNARDTC